MRNITNFEKHLIIISRQVPTRITEPSVSNLIDWGATFGNYFTKILNALLLYYDSLHWPKRTKLKLLQREPTNSQKHKLFIHIRLLVETGFIRQTSARLTDTNTGDGMPQDSKVTVAVTSQESGNTIHDEVRTLNKNWIAYVYVHTELEIEELKQARELST